MTKLDTDTVLQDVQDHNRKRADRATDALTYFQDKAGSLIQRQKATAELSTRYDWSEETANQSIADVVGDIVDPVQQVVHPDEGKLVGIIDYYEWPDSGCYGYLDYDDVVGKRKRVVCSQCVVEANTDVEVTHATEGEGSFTDDISWNRLSDAIKDHYVTDHEIQPSEIEVGASLASGTTISGNKSFHAGNDGVGSGLEADIANTVVADGPFNGVATANELLTRVHTVSEGGTVPNSDAFNIWTTHLTDGDTLSVLRYAFLSSDGTTVPSGVDLAIATLDGNGGFTRQTQIQSGGTVTYDATGSLSAPQATYTASSNGPVAVVVDNASGNKADVLTELTVITE